MINWPEISRCFAILRPVKWFDRRALDFLNGISSTEPVIVACSGGADSVFLVLSMNAVMGADRLHIAHYNHGLRGDASDGDEEFVTSMGNALGIPVHSARAEENISPDEDCLRRNRYQWLGSLCRGLHASAIVLGHHADDLIESQMMALLGGTGPAGLITPMPVRRFPEGQVRLRPLLGMKRSTIEKTLRSLQIPWREDATNKDMNYTRNWIRHELLPQLQERIPQDLHMASSRTRQLMEEAIDAIDAFADSLAINLDCAEALDVGRLVNQPAAVARRVVFAWWLRHFPDARLSADTSDLIVKTTTEGDSGMCISVGKLAIPGYEHELPARLILEKSGLLVLCPENEPAPIKWSAGCTWNPNAGPLFLPDGSSLMAEAASWAEPDLPYIGTDPAKSAWITGTDGPIHVRQWTAGDRYQPLGAPGRRKLQDLFSDAKLNSEQKSCIPVILDREGRILWVPGFPPADFVKVCQNHNRALKLTYIKH